MRKYAAFALLAWITGWIVIVLQPCCEAIAVAIPHDELLSINPGGHDHSVPGEIVTEHPLQTSVLTHEHEQCLNELPMGQGMESLVILKQGRIDQKIKFASLPLKSHLDPTVISVSDRQYNYNSPQEIPPPQNLYQRTKRMRI